MKRYSAKLTPNFLDGYRSELDDLNAAEMAEIVRLYKNELAQRRLVIPEDPYEQLRESVNAVYRSCMRKSSPFQDSHEDIGTLGDCRPADGYDSSNRKGSGASSFLRANPLHSKREFTATRKNATGDDLVYGKLINRPLAKAQVLQGQRSLERKIRYSSRCTKNLQWKSKAHGRLPQEVRPHTLPGRRKKNNLCAADRRMEFKGLHKTFPGHLHDGVEHNRTRRRRSRRRLEWDCNVFSIS